MARYFAIAEKAGKKYQGFLDFETPVERMVELFHSHGIAVDFYENVSKTSSKYVELGLKEEGNHEDGQKDVTG